MKFSKQAKFEREPAQAAKKRRPCSSRAPDRPTSASAAARRLGEGGRQRHARGPAAARLAPADPGERQDLVPEPARRSCSTGASSRSARSEKFIGHLESVSVNYKLFAPDGTPTRAEVDLKLKDLPEEPKKQNPTLGRRHDAHRVRRAARGETHAVDRLPASTATRRCGGASPTANGIDDPFHVAAGHRAAAAQGGRPPSCRPGGLSRAWPRRPSAPARSLTVNGQPLRGAARGHGAAAWWCTATSSGPDSCRIVLDPARDALADRRCRVPGRAHRAGRAHRREGRGAALRGPGVQPRLRVRRRRAPPPSSGPSTAPTRSTPGGTRRPTTT